MNVTIYKTAKDVSNGFQKSVLFCLERIKNGASKDKINHLRKLSEIEYNKQKSTLPGVCFNGTFSYRSIAGLIEHSGLIVLDFDKFKTIQETIDFKNSICDDQYIYSAWISPSGKGIKALVKIPAISENHKEYFKSLKEYYSHENWDDSGSDVSRFCFESYDPEIYINQKSIIWDKIDEPEVEDLPNYSGSVFLKSDSIIISNLVKWFDKKYSITSGQRNVNMFKLAIAFNDYGITESVAKNKLYEYQNKDFPIKEIDAIIKSAYKKNANFGTKFFEDKEVTIKIEKQIRSGKSKKEVIDYHNNFNKKEIENAIEKIKDNLNIEEFWYYNDKGKIGLEPHKFKFWLQQNNYFKFFPENQNTFTFINISENLVDETNEKRIKDFVLEKLLSMQDIGFAPYDFMASNPKFFQQDYLSFLETSNIEIMEDSQEDCYLYFKNCAVKITENSIEKIDYVDIKGFVWRKQIIDRDFEEVDHHKSEYRNFMWLICGKDVEKYNSLKSVIGYLLHSFKTSASNKAIILNDETISENPNGGSGKGVFCNAISKMKKMSIIDGKNFEFNKSFPYQTVSQDTQVLVFDDVKKNFSFESLFSLITEGLTLEYKGQDAIRIPVRKSPKIIISTNYTIGGVGGSHERRKFEVEFSDYFNYKYTPLEEFGHLLFDDWSDLEWSMFDNYMIQCVQYFLKNGLSAHDFKNLEVRKFIKNTSFEFFEWTKQDNEITNIPFNQRLDKQIIYNAFLVDYPDYKTYKLSQKTFTKWVDAYCKFYNFKYLSGSSNGQRWFEILKENQTESDDEERVLF